MKLSIYGTGYVGLVTGACLAELGHDVLCLDISVEKIAALKRGEIPIYEPGLQDIVRRHIENGRLQFTLDYADAVAFGQCQFIAVGTPTTDEGAADLQFVYAVAKSIAKHMNDYRLIIDKSTVPVGTAKHVKDIIQSELDARGVSVDFDVASNPEFLKEGAAVKDFLQPDRIVVGSENTTATRLIDELYKPLTQQGYPLVHMDLASAELTKYAANAMLASRISFINEIAAIAESTGADIETIAHGLGIDPRIGPEFLRAGCGYGGSCFPKDVKALIHTAKNLGISPYVLEAIDQRNHAQKQLLVEKICHYYANQIQGKHFAIWGLAFKPHTDDMRQASSITIIEGLTKLGATVSAFDPIASENAKKIFHDNPHVTIADNKTQTLEQADGLIIATEWPQFKNADLPEIKNTLKHPVIFDGRNIFEAKQLKALGIDYISMGRAVVVNNKIKEPHSLKEKSSE